MYTLEIINHLNKKTKLTKYMFFFSAIFKMLRHKTKHSPYLTMTWSVHKDPYMIQANNSEFMYKISKGDNHMLGYWLKMIGIGTITIAVTLTCLFTWAYTPIVYKSYSTGKCVRIESQDALYTCDNLPTRYKHVFVE